MAGDISEVGNLAARLRAGSSERCASCLRWVDKKGVGAVSAWFPKDGGQAIPYVVCRRCMRKGIVSYMLS
jgi:ribosomal protein L28